MIADSFIKRPRLATVISLVLVLAGLLVMFSMPVEQYPNITPPQVSVTATYLGASSDVLEATVAQPIESSINGVENMLYMSSTSGDDGTYQLTVTFKVGTNPSINTVNVQNRIKQIESSLPEEVVQQGVNVKSKQSSMLQIFSVVSDTDKYDSLFLTNYVLINMKDELARVNGVGEVHVFSDMDYSMRIWLNNDKLKNLRLSVNDVLNALRTQNIQAPLGRIGAMPSTEDQQLQFSLN